AAPVFSAIVNDTVPVPVPVELPVTEIHAALGVAVHVQPDAVVTVTESLPPAAAMLVVVFDSEYEQAGEPEASFNDPSGRIVASLVCGPGAAEKYVVGLRTI